MTGKSRGLLSFVTLVHATTQGWLPLALSKSNLDAQPRGQRALFEIRHGSRCGTSVLLITQVTWPPPFSFFLHFSGILGNHCLFFSFSARSGDREISSFLTILPLVTRPPQKRKRRGARSAFVFFTAQRFLANGLLRRKCKQRQNRSWHLPGANSETERCCCDEFFIVELRRKPKFVLKKIPIVIFSHWRTVTPPPHSSGSVDYISTTRHNVAHVCLWIDCKSLISLMHKLHTLTQFEQASRQAGPLRDWSAIAMETLCYHAAAKQSQITRTDSARILILVFACVCIPWNMHVCIHLFVWDARLFSEGVSSRSSHRSITQQYMDHIIFHPQSSA